MLSLVNGNLPTPSKSSPPRVIDGAHIHLAPLESEIDRLLGRKPGETARIGGIPENETGTPEQDKERLGHGYLTQLNEVQPSRQAKLLTLMVQGLIFSLVFLPGAVGFAREREFSLAMAMVLPAIAVTWFLTQMSFLSYDKAVMLYRRLTAADRS